MARRNKRIGSPEPTQYTSSPRLFIPPPHRTASPVERALEDAPDLIAREADLPAVRAAHDALPGTYTSKDGAPTREDMGPLLGAVMSRDTGIRAVTANHGAPHISVLIADLDVAEAHLIGDAFGVRVLDSKDDPARRLLIVKRAKALDLLRVAADHIDDDTRATMTAALADLDTLRSSPR